MEVIDQNGVTAIEWAEKIRGDLPLERIDLHFDVAIDETRDITITAYGNDALTVARKVEQRLKEKK